MKYENEYGMINTVMILCWCEIILNYVIKNKVKKKNVTLIFL